VIKYALVCQHEHGFEGWFGSSSDYDDQSQRGLLQCPICGSGAVRKQIMAPAVSGTKAQKTVDVAPGMREMMMEAMGAVRSHVEENFDYVGDSFAKEARAIHEGRSEERGIYGEATPKEVEALKQDGVQVAQMPPAPPKKEELN
jgi:hypothetical protein